MQPQLNIVPPAPRLYPQVPTAPPPPGAQPGLSQMMHQMSMGPHHGAERYPSRETPVYYTDARTPMPPRQRPQFPDYANSHRMLAPDHNPWMGMAPPDARRWSTTYENYDGSLAPSQSTRPPPSIHYGPSQGYCDDNYVGDPLFDPPEEMREDPQASRIPAADNTVQPAAMLPSTQPAGPPVSAAPPATVAAAQGAPLSNQPPAGGAAPPASVAVAPRTGGTVANRPPAASAASLPAPRQVRVGDGASMSQAQLAAAYYAMQQRAPIMASQAQPSRYYNYPPAYGYMGHHSLPPGYTSHPDPYYYYGYDWQPYRDRNPYYPQMEPPLTPRRPLTPRPSMPPTPGAPSQFDYAPDNPPPAARGQDYAPRLRAELWNADPLDVPAIHVADYLAGHFQSLRPQWGKDLHNYVGHFSKPGNVWKDYCGTTGQTLREWKIIFEDTANILCIPKILWAMGARLRMTGAARKKLTQEDPSSYWSYNEMCRRLADEFDRTARPALLAALHSKKQKPNEPVGAYCARVMDAFLQAYPEKGHSGHACHAKHLGQPGDNRAPSQNYRPCWVWICSHTRPSAMPRQP